MEQSWTVEDLTEDTIKIETNVDRAYITSVVGDDETFLVFDHTGLKLLIDALTDVEAILANREAS